MRQTESASITGYTHMLWHVNVYMKYNLHTDGNMKIE